MGYLALIILTGRLGRDAEVKYTGEGTPIGKWSIGVNTGFPKEKEICSWYNCAMFGKRAESLAKYLCKGALITVVGEPHIREWEKDGKRGTSVEVNVREVTLLGTGRASKGFNNLEPSETEADAESEAREPEQGSFPDGEVPF